MRHRNYFDGAWLFGASQNQFPPIASFLVVLPSVWAVGTTTSCQLPTKELSGQEEKEEEKEEE